MPDGLTTLLRACAGAAVLFLGACAASSPEAVAPAAQRPGCVVTLAAEAPFSVESGKLLVPATINGAEARLIVDTGVSGGLTLDRSAEANRRFGVEPSGRISRYVTPAGAEIDFAGGIVDEVRIGGAGVRRMSVDLPVAPSRFRPDQPGDGLLGAAFLSQFDVEFDPGARRFRLYQTQGCDEAISPPFRTQGPILVRQSIHGLPFVPMRFGAASVEALLDSGADLTMLSLDGVSRAGVSQERLRTAPPSGRLTDAQGNACETCAIRFDRVSLGDLEFRDVDVPVVRASTRIEAYVGLDLLLARRTLISYSTGQLFLAAAP